MAHSNHSSNFELNRRKFIHYSSLTLGTGILAACKANNTSQVRSTRFSSATPAASSGDLDRITLGISWFATPEYGGFYQAIAQGIYKEQGLDVTITMGGPQVNITQRLMGGEVDFGTGFGADAIQAIQQGIPKITVAAIFQKDPQVLIAHPGMGVDSLEDLKGKPVFISAAANTTYWPFLKAKYGFTDDQKRPYNFNPGPFLADRNSAQQGYLTSEPLQIEQAGKFEPVVFLLADYGYQPYATTIETKRELVEQNPDLVQRFVEASLKGWYSYLEDPAPGNELIKKENPEVTDEQLAFSHSKIKEYKLVTGGNAEKFGIGAMTKERWQALAESMVATNILKPSTKYEQAFTLQFINRGVDAYLKS
jgi:NitT/TauT family transport system substrate-binding protein